MSDISHLSTQLGASSARVARFERNESVSTPTDSPARHGRSRLDEVDISPDARRQAAVGAAEGQPDLAKVAEVKARIAGGGYDSEARLQVALDRMIDDVLA